MENKIKKVNKVYVGINDIFTEFIKWSVMTKRERQDNLVPTAKVFAEKYNLHPSQLSRWKERDDFRWQKEQSQREKLQELTPDVIDAFFKRCIKYGMSNDIELWLKLVEGWDKKKVVEHKEIQFGPNDIRVLIAKLSPEKKKNYYTTLARLLADAREANDAEKDNFNL